MRENCKMTTQEIAEEALAKYLPQEWSVKYDNRNKGYGAQGEIDKKLLTIPTPDTPEHLLIILHELAHQIFGHQGGAEGRTAEGQYHYTLEGPCTEAMATCWALGYMCSHGLNVDSETWRFAHNQMRVNLINWIQSGQKGAPVIEEYEKQFKGEQT